MSISCEVSDVEVAMLIRGSHCDEEDGDEVDALAHLRCPSFVDGVAAMGGTV